MVQKPMKIGNVSFSNIGIKEAASGIFLENKLKYS